MGGRMGKCDFGVDPGARRSLEWTDLPLDMHVEILAYIPLADLARQATVSKNMLGLYKERLRERQTCIDAHLAVGWPVEVTRGLSRGDTDVPRDLVVSPPVSLCALQLFPGPVSFEKGEVKLFMPSFSFFPFLGAADTKRTRPQSAA
jgi:hypothetical protein